MATSTDYLQRELDGELLRGVFSERKIYEREKIFILFSIKKSFRSNFPLRVHPIVEFLNHFIICCPTCESRVITRARAECLCLA